MRTVNKIGGANGTIFTEFYGNTTDVKPTEDVPNGSAFYEIDNNMQEYRFDKENKIWYPITRGGTAPSDDYLPLSGGIMTGDINMNGNSLLNAKSITLKDETGEYTVALNLVHLETTNPETREPFSYEVIEFSNSDDTSKQYVITGVADPLLDTDAANKAYVDQETAKYLPLTGGKMTGNIDLNNRSIYRINDLTFNLDVQLKSGVGNNRIYLQVIRRGTDNKLSVKAADAVEDDELVTKSQMETADSKYLPLTGTTEDNPVTGVVTFNGESTITGVSIPVNDTDVVTKKYADDIKEYGIEHSPVLDSGQEEFVLGQNDLAYVFKNSMVMDSGDRFYFADPVSLTDGRLVPFITSAMTGEEYHLLVGTYPKGVQNGTLAPVQIDGVATPTGDNMAVNKKYVDNAIKSITENQVTIQKADNANMCINLTVNGDEASGILDLTDKNGNPVIVRGVDTPVQDTDAVNKKYFEIHLPTDFTPTKDLDMKQYKLINTSAVEIYGGINDSANNTYFIRETSQASINTDTEIPEYVKVITGVHTGDTNQDVILRGIRAGQQKNDAVNYNQFKTLADSFERCQHDVESLNAWKMTFDENQVTNTVNSIIKYTDVAYELTIASGEEQWYSYDLAMQSGYTPISATLVIDDTNPFVGHCSLDITPDGTYNALIYLKSQGDDKTCNCKVRLVWIKNQ